MTLKSAKLDKDKWLWMIPLLLIITFLGARGLNRKAIWYDEWWSVYYAGTSPLYGPIPLAETTNRILSEHNEFNPPGYYFALNVWSSLTGTTTYNLRAWSLLLGLLTLAFTYRIGRDLVSWRAGLAAALMLGFSAFFITYLHEMRAYIQLAFFSAALLWSYARLVTRSPKPVWVYMIFAVSILGLCYTHYMGFTVLGALGLYHLFFAPKNKGWLWVTLLGIVMGLLFLPWIEGAYQAFTSATTNVNQNQRSLDALELTRSFLNALGNASLVWIGVLLVLAYPARRLLWLWFIIAFVLTLVINQLFHFITDPRYLIALAPLLAVLCGIGLVRLPVGQRAAGVIWALAGIWITFVPAPPAPGEWSLFLPWQEIRHEMQSLAQPDDDFVYFLPPPVVNWFHARIAEYYLSDLSIQYHVVDSPDPRVKDDDAYRKEADDFVGDAQRVWIARQPDNLPYPIVEREFLRSFGERGFADCGVFYESVDVNLKLYVRASNPVISGQFGDGITLNLLQPLAKPSDNNLQVLLGWSIAQSVPSNTYSVGLHIMDTNNELVRQVDYGLPASDAPCQPNTLSLDGLTAGNYSLQAMVYAWQTGERLKIGHSDYLTLGTFNVDG
ncbi:MAG: hypothetical protein GC179_16640 [Anaerolineaceae bacterium]|nr:hypothetical protein [Anaerolineaceae bacterium]